MYLKLQEVTLVGDKRKARNGDRVVYKRAYGPDTIFTTDASPSKYSTEPQRYGVLYFDGRDRPCIVPDAWNEDDALRAKEAFGPEGQS